MKDVRNSILVQALLDSNGVLCAPHVIARGVDGRLSCLPLEREVAATVFVNGCAVICTQPDAAVSVLKESVRLPMSAAVGAIKNIDITLKRHGLCASRDANDSVAVIVPFDGSEPLVI